MLHYAPLTRTVIRILGKDRVSHLHNFCTADVKGMSLGEVREAMVLDSKGKLLGLVHLLAGPEELMLVTVPDQAGTLIGHLDRYVIREDVRFVDSSAEPQHWLVFPTAGMQPAIDGDSGGLPSGIDWPAPGRFLDSTTESGLLRIARAGFAGDSLLVQCEAGSTFRIGQWLASAGVSATEAERGSLDRYRVWQRCPWFGVDCNPDNLPQELDRDGIAISFTKGCYLGQETVARIDALGHVNRKLAILQSVATGPLPAVGSRLVWEGKTVGTLTTVTADGDRWCGLAMLRRAAAKAGTRLEWLAPGADENPTASPATAGHPTAPHDATTGRPVEEKICIVVDPHR